MTPIRLHVDVPLSPRIAIEATAAQAHYLGAVMRRRVGDPVRVFNGRDGEWEARVVTLSRDAAALVVEAQARPQQDAPDLWLLFGVLKRDATDMVVQKATELGAAALIPVFTERTNAARVNQGRLRAIAVEAAEQSERLTVPDIRDARPLAEVLAAWPCARPLFVAMEREGAPGLPRASGPAAVLVGPEGGFGSRDRGLLEHYPFVRRVSLGQHILRAETAAIVGLALLQAPGCG